MRTRTMAAAGLLLLLAAAGCGKAPAGDQVASAGGTPAASAGASAAADRDEDAPLKFSQCMREQGLTWFPDPKPDGGLQIKVPKGTDKAKVDAAMAACKQWAPGGGDHGPADPELLEQARRMAQCMREHGVPDFPDPQADGSVRLDGDKIGMGPGDPAFDQADEACAQFRPQGRAGSNEASEG
ncbi:hypothetical protein [Actinoplanes sp. NPDC049599]|uniref:hypothetical protein n=1 Tax=Actinoplanes sp. NPDC049599 TaxID=3363903 RepID=UPI0037A8E1C1